MKDISLKDLLEAGCHFGHKVERWHPKAAAFIFQEREGLHIIDLAKTREGLKSASEFILQLSKEGKNILFVATKRQAKGVVTDAAKRAGIPYMTNRWIGGFITNWEQVVKNIQKLTTMRKEKEDGSWSKFPKHEIVALDKTLRKVDAVYGGVSQLTGKPDAIFIIDIKKEVASLREAMQYGIKIAAIVDTNADPNLVDFPIPANDDAVGSIKFITDYLADAYMEGKKMAEKKEIKNARLLDGQEKLKIKKEKEEVQEKTEEKKEEKPKKRGRKKKA
ncbi:30S ribosomal protein S2 [Candidatus Gottesmanbacteria bacterium]|nr:30S ribosomal protein S2 [Candidatus Gottesmanbacteria bacterium]